MAKRICKVCNTLKEAECFRKNNSYTCSECADINRYTESRMYSVMKKEVKEMKMLLHAIQQEYRRKTIKGLICAAKDVDKFLTKIRKDIEERKCADEHIN